MTDGTRRERGFTLPEVLIAAAMLLAILLVAYAVYDSGQSSYRLYEDSADNSQRTRLACFEMVERLRLAGYDTNRDGAETNYPDQPDEQIEFAHPRAIAVRANYDASDPAGGRETALELPPSDPGFGVECCPVVTTGNDEIVTYALRSETASANNDSIALKLDSQPANRRDGTLDGAVALGEETLTISGVDLDGATPPYSIVRFMVNSAGTGFDEAVIATGILSLEFRYRSGNGADWFCLNPASDGSCPAGEQFPLASASGGDHWGGSDGKRRKARAAIRQVEILVTGLNTASDPRWTEPGSPPGTPVSHRRRFRLQVDLRPPNLGLRGRVDPGEMDLDIPTNVVLCGGQCDTIKIEWDKVSGAGSYKVDLYDNSQTPPAKIFSRQTPGIAVPGSSPPRVFGVYQRGDDPDIRNGQRFVARVTAIAANGATSEPSDWTGETLVQDVARPDAPVGLVASGYNPEDPSWPDTSLVSPESDPQSDWYPRLNEIVLRWAPPHDVLDVRDQGDPANTWDCRVNNLTAPALACDQEVSWDSDGDTVPDRARTPVRDLVGDIRFLVFRSRNARFVPTDADLVAEIRGDIDPVTGLVTWKDTTAHEWSDGDTWQRTTEAVPCCSTWYYRVRAVDSCWSGGSPSSKTDSHLSPFDPPLNAGDVQDSDDTSGLTPDQVGLAIPGYSIPDARPAAPRELRARAWDPAALTFQADFLASKRDSASKPASYRFYRLYSHPTDPAFQLDSYGNAAWPGRVDADIEVRDLAALAIARNDEDGDGIEEDSEDETNNGTTGDTDLVVSLPDGTPRYYRLVAFQCNSDAIANDNGDITAWDFGLPSNAIRVPCQFGGSPASTIVLDDSLWPSSLTATMNPGDPTVHGATARLFLMDPDTGEGSRSAEPGIGPTVPGSDVFVFDSGHISNLLAEFPGDNFVKIVEIRDQYGCYGMSNDTPPAAPPGCCIDPGNPVAWIVAGTQRKHARQDLTESCGNNLQIQRITVTTGNENGGQPDRIREVYWGTTLIWQGSSNTAVIDRTSNPLPLPANATRTLKVVHDRSVQGDSLMVGYEYQQGGSADSCSFTQPTLQE